MVASSQANLILYNSNTPINNALLNELQVGEIQTIVFEPVVENLNSLNLEISNQTQSQDCNTDNNSLNLNSFNLTVDDQELQDHQYFNVQVNEVNTAPSILSVPSGTINAGVFYQYNIDAHDNNKGDSLEYQLIQGQHLAKINPYSGEFTWLPEADTISPTSFTVTVRDLAGLSDTVEFQLETTQALIVPKITSLPPRVAQPNNLYIYQLEAEASTNSILFFDLLKNPESMSIDAISGLISWDVSDLDQGDVFTVTVRVTDQFNNSDTQSYLLAIDEDSLISPTIDRFNHIRTTLENQFYQSSAYFRDANAIDFFQVQLNRAPEGMVIISTSLDYPNLYTDYDFEFQWPEPKSSILEQSYFTNHWCGSEEAWLNLSMTKDETQLLGTGNVSKFQSNILHAALSDSDNNGFINSNDNQILIYANDEGVFAHSIIENKQLWSNNQVITTNDNYTAVPNNALTIANINADLTREVLVIGDDRYITALTHDGQILWQSTDQIAVNS